MVIIIITISMTNVRCDIKNGFFSSDIDVFAKIYQTISITIMQKRVARWTIEKKKRLMA